MHQSWRTGELPDTSTFPTLKSLFHRATDADNMAFRDAESYVRKNAECQRNVRCAIDHRETNDKWSKATLSDHATRFKPLRRLSTWNQVVIHEGGRKNQLCETLYLFILVTLLTIYPSIF